jgi:uncharacterized protein YggE
MEKRKKIPMLVTCIIIITIMAGMSTALNTSAVKAEDTTHETTEETPEEPHGEITITGTAFQECEPDLLVIILKIKTLDSESAEKARDEAARIIDNVLKTLKKLGIQDEYIETTSYKIQPKYEWENDVRVFKGYQVVVTIKVTLKDFNKAGQVIDNSVNAGAYVDSINFELSREKQNNIKIQLLAEAAKDAKIKAEAIVTALGDELGNVKRVNVNDYYYQPYRYWAKSDSYGINGESMAPPTQIMPSDLTLSANVNVVFEIL